jgi:hypothetical protein
MRLAVWMGFIICATGTGCSSLHGRTGEPVESPRAPPLVRAFTAPREVGAELVHRTDVRAAELRDGVVKVARQGQERVEAVVNSPEVEKTLDVLSIAGGHRRRRNGRNGTDHVSAEHDPRWTMTEASEEKTDPRRDRRCNSLLRGRLSAVRRKD